MNIPFYVITASVPTGNRVLRFHGAGEDSASHLLTHVPRFRLGSFDVATPDTPRLGPEDSIELRVGMRKLLRLYQDGTLVFRVRADHDFLGWGLWPDAFQRTPRLNPVPVVEVHTSFVHLYCRVLEQLKERASAVAFKLSLDGGAWDNQRLFLTEYFSGTVDWDLVTRYHLQENPSEEEVELSGEDVLALPNRAAYILISKFVSMFDMPETKIPFTRVGTAGPEIDVETIQGLR